MTPVTPENRRVRNRAAWVPICGRSLRMGTDKALIDIAGRPLVLRVARQAIEFCESVALVGDPALSGKLGLKVVPDHMSIRAVLESGIRKITDALRRLEADGFAVRYLPVASPEPFANLNTPDEVQKYLNG